ncbi:hypothetical protein ABIE61_000343 [Marinobacterium sp. MBR-111]|jgi:hypothetical protein|uniref:hypothetical protein n=1 Tax=Marinobacterium sp. MBR-111 TaxID=3156463 RepID=UPI00339A654F
MNIVTEIASMRGVLEDLKKRIGTRQAEGITDMDPLIARLIGRKVELERALVVIEPMRAELERLRDALAYGKALCMEHDAEVIELLAGELAIIARSDSSRLEYQSGYLAAVNDCFVKARQLHKQAKEQNHAS